MVEVEIRDFSDWDFNNEIDLMIVDPPFGINFDKDKGNYSRKKELVVGGYVEWDIDEYRYKIRKLINCASGYLSERGSLLIFSSWLSSIYVSSVILNESIGLNYEGKLTWVHNFPTYCSKRAAHNNQEIFWLTKTDGYFYNNRCSLPHCSENEMNLSTIIVNKEFIKGITKYKTKQPSILCGTIIEHFSKKGFKIFDPCCGSGIYGVVVRYYYNDREIYLGDLNNNSRLVYRSLVKYLPFLEINKHKRGNFGLKEFAKKEKE